jgi:hypothetical protein
MPPGSLRPVEGLASAAFLLAALLWVLSFLFAFASGWGWAFVLGWGALSFVLGLPFGVVAVVMFGRDTSRVLLKAFGASMAALVANLGLTSLLIALDVL